MSHDTYTRAQLSLSHTHAIANAQHFVEFENFVISFRRRKNSSTICHTRTHRRAKAQIENTYNASYIRYTRIPRRWLLFLCSATCNLLLAFFQFSSPNTFAPTEKKPHNFRIWILARVLFFRLRSLADLFCLSVCVRTYVLAYLCMRSAHIPYTSLAVEPVYNYNGIDDDIYKNRNYRWFCYGIYFFSFRFVSFRAVQLVREAYE